MTDNEVDVREARVAALEARIKALEARAGLPPNWSLEQFVSEFEKDTLRMLEWLEGWWNRKKAGHETSIARETWDQIQDRFQGELTANDLLDKLKRLVEFRKQFLLL